MPPGSSGNSGAWKLAKSGPFASPELARFRACRGGRASSTFPVINSLLSTVLVELRRLIATAGAFAALAMLAVTSRGAEVPLASDHRVGDRATNEIVTPIPLVVFDAARTEELRRAEAQKATPIFRYLSGLGRQAEEDLKSAFAQTRARFEEGVSRLYGHPVPLLTAELGQPRFGEFINSFREQNSTFPMNTNLAELWGLGDSGEVALNALLARLRGLTNNLVRLDAPLPAGEKLTPGLVQLVAVDSLKTALTLGDVDKQGRNLAWSNLVTLARARQDAQRNVRTEERTMAQFVAGFLQPNCVFDEELTRQSRARRVEAINAVDRYEARQVIVKQGEIITAKAKLALDELKARTAVDRVQAEARLQRSRVEAESVEARRAAVEARQANRRLWIWLGASGVAMAAFAVLWWRRRRMAAQADVSFALARAGDVAWDDGVWRERALAAEDRAQKATAILRANLLPHMARWMMKEMMQRLLSQRTEILTSQQQAEREVAELADRLELLHAPLEDRLKAYERRIAELEAELAAKGLENQDLIQAQIETMRKKLEGERSQEPMNWS